MAAPSLITDCILLFGGQGSSDIFSSGTSIKTEEGARSSSIGSIFLSRCHAAFLQELASLNSSLRHLVGIDAAHFSSPSDLLRPDPQYHTHAVLQAITIYVCQLARCLTVMESAGRRYEDSWDGILETAGFSSGILPAMTIARSQDRDCLINNGVEGLRLGFWIACRVHLRCVKASRGKFSQETVDPAATCSLVIRGLSIAEVEDKISQHCQSQSSYVPAQQTSRQLHVSAVSTSGAISVSGHMLDLPRFKAQAIPEIASTFAYVHGWYHGGCQLEDVVAGVLTDVDRRRISFTSCRSAKPVSSTLDGTPFDSTHIESGKLCEWLIRHLLIYPVNWQDTAGKIAERIKTQQDLNRTRMVQLLSFGPSSNSLFPSLPPSSPMVELIDLSPFVGNKSTPLSNDYRDSIAVVGIGMKLPKVNDTEELWKTLSEGLIAVQEIPETRFDVSQHQSTDAKQSRSMLIKHGAFLNNVFNFDNEFFNISPREARSMDPQQRILLSVTQDALEDAGYVGDATPASNRHTTGCYVGVATGDYTSNLRDDIDVFYSPGTLRSFHSGRISYVNRLSGPSIVTDTACSSSIVAVQQACTALQRGDCTTAIAGGVNTISSPDMYLGLARGHFLSSTGGCKPFDAAADGYCRAEGCVVLVLKRLSDAIAENDHIHGIIRGVVTNQSGHSHSITHPHSPTQVDLLRRLLRRTNIGPGSVSVIEAHGTGTQAGDACEIDSLKEVFGSHHSLADPLYVSSVKGNIGHSEAASGVAGMAKLLLMLRERRIPPQAAFKKINPRFGNLEDYGLVIPIRSTAWSSLRGAPRRAILNNFGAAGSNTSLLLEEWRPPRSSTGALDRSSYVFVLSAKSPSALQILIVRYLDLLENEPHGRSLQDICYTAVARRHFYDYRIAMTCRSIDDLKAGLVRNKTAHFSPAKKVTALIFIFSGQGAIYSGMAQEMLQSCPVFKNMVMECNNIVCRMGYPSILHHFSREMVDAKQHDAEDVITSQCACVALEYALAKLLISWGFVPDYVLGHSLGEYGALCVTGVLSLEDTMRVVASRAKMMTEHCTVDSTGMLACAMSPEMAGEMISQSPRLPDLTVTCLNGLASCVVGGPLNQLEVFKTMCRSQRVQFKAMDVPYAFHSPAMDPIVEPLCALGSSVQFSKPTLPIYSNVYGRLFREADFSPDYFALHARKPVRFSKCIQDLRSQHSLNNAALVEIGPHPTMLSSLKQSVPADTCTFMGTLHKAQESWASLSSTLASVSLLKVRVKWREVFDGTCAQMTKLPGHPLQGPEHVVPYREPGSAVTSLDKHSQEAYNVTGFHLLPWMSSKHSSNERFVLKTTLAILSPLIIGHSVGGSPICPASVFHELALEGAQTVLQPPADQSMSVADMDFMKPLVYAQCRELTEVTVYIATAAGTSGATFRITSSSDKDSTEVEHCTGRVLLPDPKATAKLWGRDKAMVERQKRSFTGTAGSLNNSFKTRILYESVFPRVVSYAPEYHTLEYMSIADSGLEGFGSFRIRSSDLSDCIAPPIFSDTLLHSAGFIANLAVRPDEVGICTYAESLEVSYRDIDYTESFTIYCSLLEVKGSYIADTVALNTRGDVIAVARGLEFKRLSLLTFQRMLSLQSNQTQPRGHAGELTLKPSTTVNANGVSKDEEVLVPRTASSDSLSLVPEVNVEEILKTIVADVSGFSEEGLDYTRSLDELGIDSLMQIEIVSKLALTFPGHGTLDHHALSECDTLDALQRTLASLLEVPDKYPPPDAALDPVSQPDSQHNTLVPPDYSPSGALSKNPTMLYSLSADTVPLCLFHDGSGQISMYARLQDHDRSTWAFFDPHFGSDSRPVSSVQQVVEFYVSHLTKSRMSPVILGGWSYGGILAFEAAHQLLAEGFDVRGLVLIDSPSPINHQPLPNEVITKIIQPDNANQSTALKEEFLFNASLLGIYKPVSLPEHTGQSLKTVMLRSQDVLDTEKLCGARYDWLSSQDARMAAIAAWEGLVGDHVEILPIPGNHFEAFTPKIIHETGAQLWKACRYFDDGEMSGI